jgi:IclR family transcriptional regulator, KDG regulon repressor
MDKKGIPAKLPLKVRGKESAVQSIRRSAEILNCISNGINSVTGIASHCRLSKSTVHRLLKALGESELVMQDPISHQYYLGYFIIKLLSSPQTTQQHLTTCAAEEMSRLSDITGETVSLGIKMGLKAINIHVVNSKSDLKVDAANMRIKPVYLGVDGKVLLSQLDDFQLSTILANMHLELKTRPGRVDPEKLKAQIKLVSRRGYAIGHSESTAGVTFISAPIKNYVMPAVVNLIGPEIRMKPRLAEFTRELLDCTARISQRIAQSHGSPTTLSPEVGPDD